MLVVLECISYLSKEDRFNLDDKFLQRLPLKLEWRASSKYDNGERDFILKLFTIIEEAYPNQELRIGELAEAMYICERQLFRKVKSILGMPPSLLLRKYRIIKALEMLFEGEPICAVGPKVGFGSYSYYSRCFKQEFGCSVSEFLQDSRSGPLLLR
ncbi:MAG: AraC family transcriptional regulator [Kangiellaceae bacterium]|nr:AraC family transcriptional regulator [Kangiellaceae bacterium]MCW9017680.1 AraC family transcriptional regulator [Kangiellaceae bacterium]